MDEGQQRGRAGAGHAPLVSAPRARRAAGSVGLLLDGRYRLEQRRTRDGSSSTWDATDDQLGRPVGIRVVAGRTAADAVDAARRCAALEDVRLARVLDVGSSQAADGGSLGWVVTERTTGRALADLLRAAPMSPARARAVVGETAAALARASSVGLHHRRLDPACVLVSPRGEVLLQGLEVAAAAAGLAPVAPGRAEREDAVGLVALLYAALTGLWPHGRFSALGAAPTSDGAPVRPSDLVGGVPDELDRLCTATLGLDDGGPRTPAELADRLTPWTAPPRSAPTGTSVREVTDLRERAIDLDAADAHDQHDAHDPRARGAAPGRPVTAAPAAADPADDLFHSLESTAPHPAVFHDDPPGADAATSPARPAGARPSAWPRGWEDTGSWDAARAAARPARTGSRGPTVWEDAPEPAVRRRASRVVLAVVTLAVLALAAVAAANLSRITGVLGLAPASSSAADGTAATAAPASTPAASPAATAAARAAGAITIASARALDPMGDSSENDAQADRAVDGDAATTWSSSTYRTARFGGLKSGLGLDLDLASPATVSSLDVTVAGTGGTLQVRSSSDGTYSPASAVLATAQVGSGGGAPVHIALATPTSARHLVLWFTTLPSTPTGFSAQVSEVTAH